MSGMGYHWTPCKRGGGAGIVIIALAVLAIGSGAVSAAVSAAVTVLEIALLVIAALGTAGVIVAAVVIWRRFRASAYPGIVERGPVREAAAATVTSQVSAGTQPAIENHVHYHYHAADGREPARVIAAEVEP